MTDRLEFRHSPQKQLGLAVLGCLLVAASFYMATHHHDPVYRVVGWAGVGLFILTTAVAIKRMVAGGTPLVFDRAGISFPTGTFGLLPWSEIKSYSVVTARGNDFLALTFNDPERVLARVSAVKRKWALANKGLGFGHWSLTFIGLTPGLDEAVAFISQYVSASV
ncbi:MAG: hypothetical protein M3041_19950 [Acidobacteriota bacterium]|nr:hypothetical protein [Acidobacteriota bacterium]